MKNLLSVILLGSLFVLVSGASAHPATKGDRSHGKQGHGVENSAQVRLRLQLRAADGAPSDLAEASGRLSFRSKKGKVQFKARIIAPAEAASLVNAVMHLELLRGEEVYNDCTMILRLVEAEEMEPMQAHFKLQGRIGGNGDKASRMLKGSCSNGVPTAMESGDIVRGFALIGEARIEVVTSEPAVIP